MIIFFPVKLIKRVDPDEKVWKKFQERYTENVGTFLFN